MVIMFVLKLDLYENLSMIKNIRSQDLICKEIHTGRYEAIEILITIGMFQECRIKKYDLLFWFFSFDLAVFDHPSWVSILGFRFIFSH